MWWRWMRRSPCTTRRAGGDATSYNWAYKARLRREGGEGVTKPTIAERMEAARGRIGYWQELCALLEADNARLESERDALKAKLEAAREALKFVLSTQTNPETAYAKVAREALAKIEEREGK